MQGFAGSLWEGSGAAGVLHCEPTIVSLAGPILGLSI